MKKSTVIIIAMVLIAVLTSCNSFFRSPTMSVGAEAVGDMPEKARNVDTYKLRFMKTVGTPVEPRATFSSVTDTLTFTFGYDIPDDLPIGDLPYGEYHEIPFDNTDDIWGPDSSATLKAWIELSPGLWAATVTAINSEGSATSGRYDFLIKTMVPVMLYLRGVFK